MHLAGLAGLFIAWWIIWAVSNVAQDLMHAKRGTENPRLALRLQRARQADQWYGPGRYVRDLISDGLEQRTKDRRLRSARRWQQQVDDAEPAVVPVPDLGPAPVVPPLPEPVAAAPPPRGVVGPARGGQPRDVLTGDRPAEPTASKLPQRWTPVVISGGASAEPEDPTPPEPPITPKETTAMPTAAVEVMGLDRSIDYTETVAAGAADHGPVGGEEYMGHLAASNVSGAAIASAAAMQQAAEALRAAAEQHAEDLRAMKTVQEAYDQNPDAGDQAYVQGGR